MKNWWGIQQKCIRISQNCLKFLLLLACVFNSNTILIDCKLNSQNFLNLEFPLAKLPFWHNYGHAHARGPKQKGGPSLSLWMLNS